MSAIESIHDSLRKAEGPRSSATVGASIPNPVRPPPKDPTGAERARQYRLRKKAVTQPVTSTVTQPVTGTVTSTVTAATATSPVTWGVSNVIAYLAAVSLTGVTAFFSVGGMAEMFPGYAAGVMVLASAMEAIKLVMTGWLARHWLSTGLILRAVLIVPIVSLATINAAGLYGRLVEAHVGVMVATTSAVVEQIGALDARLEAQIATVAGFNQRLSEIDAVIAEMTKRGRTSGALAAISSQRQTRDALIANRQEAAAVLVDLRTERAKVDGERQRIEASAGPIRYIAVLAGVEVETAIRCLILLMVLTCDPAAIALTVAVSRPGYPGPEQVTVRMPKRDVFSARRLLGGVSNAVEGT